MAENVYMPKLSEVMIEGKLAEWKVEEGAWVEEHKIIVVIETEKVTLEIEAPAAGFLHILKRAGSVLPVGAVIGQLARTKEELEGLQAGAPPAGPPGAQQDVSPSDGRPRERERIPISPAARKMAEEHRIDLSRIVGTGPAGRIVREDIEKAIGARLQAPAAPEGPISGTGPAAKRVKKTIPMTGVRKTMCERMRQSLQISAQVSNTGTVDMTEMIKWREALLGEEKALGGRITFTDLFVKVAAEALKVHPVVNASLVGEEIILWEDVHIGVAVDLPREDEPGNLLVPVVRNADRKSLAEIHAALSDLVEKARSGRILPDDCLNHTFTISNTGVFDVSSGFGTPILNQPEVALWTTRPFEYRPVARDGQVVIRPIMDYSVTYDHRVLTGGDVMRFRATLEGFMKNPSRLFNTNTRNISTLGSLSRERLCRNWVKG